MLPHLHLQPVMLRMAAQVLVLAVGLGLEPTSNCKAAREVQGLMGTVRMLAQQVL